jgi:uncharacterized protein involved in type VI secretion and phage assembly
MSPDESIAGVATAIVRDNRDPSGLGRVSVSFPWHSRADETFWARVATPLAGKAHGFSFTPEIDDEVLVAFDHGDVRSPFVVGSLWNSTDRPPTGNARGGSGVQLQLSDGKRLTFDKRGIALDDGQGNTISIEGGTGRITIEAASSIALKAPQISIESSGGLELKSSGSLTLRGSIININ